MSTEIILEKINQIPKDYQQEVIDFIDFLLEKKIPSKPSIKKERKLGLLKGKMKMSNSFDEPLADFKEYMD